MMANIKEAKTRIKINKLLEQAGWRFFEVDGKRENILLELNTRITKKDVGAFGEDFERTQNGYVDFLLVDDKGFPLVVLEAKKEEKNPLDGKEQARRYAQSLNVRFVILSNEMNRMGTGGTYKEVSKSMFEKIKIPIPPMDIQKKLVKEIEREEQIVNANLCLIKAMEIKVKSVIENI